MQKSSVFFNNSDQSDYRTVLKSDEKELPQMNRQSMTLDLKG